MLIQACLILLALADPNILPNEVAWLDDPNILPTLFTEWQDERAEPYITVLIENWLRMDRHRNYPKIIDGVLYDTWTAPYAWVSDLNHDDVVDIHDFGIVAQFYQDGLAHTPPMVVPSKLEALAMFGEMLFMENNNDFDL